MSGQRSVGPVPGGAMRLFRAVKRAWEWVMGWTETGALGGSDPVTACLVAVVALLFVVAIVGVVI